MPFALLLGQALSPLRAGGRRLARWPQLLGDQLVVLERARGAFLSRWFGAGLPARDGALVVAVANLAEVRTAVLRRRAGGPAERPSLLEPLAGWGGTLVGLLAAPFTSVLLAAAVVTAHEHGLVERWWVAALGGLVFVSGGLLTQSVLTPLLAGFGLLAGLALPPALLALSATPRGRAALSVLRRLVTVAGQVRALADQLLGRAPVANPLLAAALQVAHGVAGLAAQLLGALAVLAARVLPLALPLVTGVLAAIALGRTLQDLLRRALADVRDGVPQLFDLRKGPLAGPVAVLRGVGRAMSVLSTRLRAYVTAFRTQLTAGLAPARTAFDDWRADAVPRARQATVEHALLQHVRALGPTIAAYRHWWARNPPGAFSRLLAHPITQGVLKVAGNAFEALLGPVPPRPPDLPTLGDLGTDAVVAEWERLRGELATSSPTHPGHLLGPAAQALADADARLPSAFAAARAAVERDAAQVPAHAEQAVRLLALAERLVPPAARSAVGGLATTLADLDRQVRPVDRRLFPVRDLPAPDVRLRPRVGRLEVVGAQDRAAAEEFVADLRVAWSRREHLVPVGRAG